MTDVAALGISVDADGVVRADKALDSFAGSADRAGNAADRTSIATSKLAQDYGRAARAAQDAARAATSQGSALSGSSAQFASQSRIVRGLVSAYDASRDAIYHWGRQLGLIRGPVNQAVGDINRLKVAANDNFNSMRSNTGNIAAQFQDIGVTAAMGMSPMMIALQQGTQLSAVFAQSGGSAFAALGGAIRQVLNPTAILTIGIVGLVAAGVQMVDWISVAKGALNGLADILEEYSTAIAYAGVVMAVAFAPQILSGIVSGVLGIANAMKVATIAMWGFAAANPFAAIVIAIGIVLAAAYVFRDELTRILGYDIIKGAVDAANSLIGTFVGAYNGIVAGWGLLPAAMGDVAIRAANATIAAIEGMVNASASLINDLTSQLPFGIGEGMQIGAASFGRLDNPYAGADAELNSVVAAAAQAAQGVDYVGKGMEFVRDMASGAADTIRGWADEIGKASEKEEKSRKGRDGKSDAQKQADEWAKLLEGADRQMRALRQAGDQVGVYGEELARLTFEQDLFNKAQDAGITLSARMTDELSSRAAEMAAQDALNKRRQFMEDVNRATEQELFLLERERGELGMAGAQLEAYRFVTEKLAEAKRNDITLTGAQIDAIRQHGDEIARQRTQIDSMSDAWKRMTQQSGDFVKKWLDDQKQRVDDARATVKGFFADWFEGARQGEGFFKSFGNSVVSSLNRIIDKLLDRTLDNWMEKLIPTNSGIGSGGGFLGGLFGSLFGGRNALGNAYGPQGITRFAQGGAFTNSIVSQPTLFRFAKGSAIGEMGEAGPEAIMPLKRGANGSLGVQMHGGGSRKTEINAPVTNHYNIGGVMTPETILAAIRQGGEDTVRTISRQLPQMMQEYDTNGAVAA